MKNKLVIRFRQLIITMIYTFYKLISFSFKNKYKDVWLISERGDEARDNGYVFFEYICKNHPEIDARYVISKKSVDLEKLTNKDKIVYLRSPLHYKLYISSKYLISSHLMGFAPEFRCFNKLGRKFKFFRGKGKIIFLQHGITQNNIPELTYKYSNIDLFICGAKPEYDFVLNNFGYKKESVKYTGFARYDSLTKNKGNFILLMPTWRKNLFYIKNDEEFKKSNYYKKINGLLNNKKLLKVLDDNNIKLIFYPHYEIQKYINSFESSKNIILANKDNYDIQKLLRECGMLVTDYSSVFFDVAYQYKPIVYYHFDYEEFKEKHYPKGYFDFNELGFGDVLENENEIVESIEKYINNNFDLDKKYKERVDNFFVIGDQNNCERIFKEIKKI